ncbi:hypothetical protein OIU84_029740 [Salix udensis]|uniref:DUF4283 domain-containing protein n=1 Tax=Salix udensis TaxID=889485 RepID=A0AAD6K9X7_9ROSI|nr:hypothetical protein OIU84_029740 [Salix udensis]
MNSRNHHQTQTTGTLPKTPPNQGDNKKTTSSWADKVKVTNADTRYSLEPIPRLPVGQQLVIPEDVMDGVDKWMRCLTTGTLPKTPPNQGDNKKTTSSWADKVKVTNADTRYSLEPIPRLPVGQQLVIPEDVMDGVDKWMRCLVGFFPGNKMPYHAINNMAMRVWRAKELESVATTANGFILFRFKNQANLQGVLEQGPWLFGGKHLILQKWDPRFQFDAGQIKTLPV